jgi:lipopolysaccharide biosynthesis glycosyltransferase
MSPIAKPRRPIVERLKWFLVNIVCTFVPSKKCRDFIRHYVLCRRVRLGPPPLPLKKRHLPINVAFGFDRGAWRQAGVALASLLANSRNRASYNIYCVVDGSVTQGMQKSLADMARGLDADSTLRFLEANHDFDQALAGTWPLAIYFRLMLPAILPDLDEIIYADTDVIFCRDLVELADFDLGKNLLAGVQERRGGYINSGLLVMNLARLRREKIHETWPGLCKREQLRFPDQDILNLTCQGRIMLLPTKYNFCPLLHSSFYRRGAIAPQDHHDLEYNVVMVHYTGSPKPWRLTRFYMSRPWWEYARLTPFYEGLRAELDKAKSG